MKQMIGLCIFFAAFGVFLYTSVPAITGDDSGELAGVGATLGIAHSPGYPLYSLVGKAVSTLVPFGNHAFRVNLVSSIFLALTSVLLFFVIYEVTQNYAVSCSAGLLFAFSKVTWDMANTTEVYGLAAFVAALISWVLFGKNRPASYLLASFLMGIGMTTHYTLGLLLFGMLWWFVTYYVLAANEKTSEPRILFRDTITGRCLLYMSNAVFFLFLGFSLIFYLYIRSQTEPIFDWEDPETLRRFWQVIARLRYGSLALAQGGAPPLALSVITAKLWFFLKTVMENFTLVGLALFVIGFWFALQDKIKGWVVLLLLCGTGPGFLIMANVNLSPGSEALLKRFFFLPFTFVVFIMALALNKIPKRFAAVSLFLPVFILTQNFTELNRRQEYMFYDYAKNILKTTPPRAVLFSDRADEMEFCVGYLHLAEKQRQDIEFVDCNAGITKSIYGSEYYRIWGKPRLAIREKVEQEIIRTTDRPVYYATFEPEMIPIKRYQEGLIYRAKPITAVKPDFQYSLLYAMRGAPGVKRLDSRGVNLLLSYHHLNGMYALATNNLSDAERSFQGVLAYDASNTWVTTIGFYYHVKNLLDHAERYYMRALSAGTANAKVLTNLGAIYEARGEKEKAKELYIKTLELEPDNIQAHFNLAVLYWKDESWQDVVREFESVLRLEPSNAEAQKYLAIARRNFSR